MMDYGRKFITTLAEDEWCLRPTSTDQKAQKYRFLARKDEVNIKIKLKLRPTSADQKARKYRFLAGKDKVKTQVWQWTIFLSISVALNVN